jgi:WD40 repeat protein
MSREPFKLFLNYRHSVADIVDRIHEVLSQEFGEGNVFQDRSGGLNAGSYLPGTLKERIESCQLVLAFINREWAEEFVAREHSNQEIDYVRLELKHALTCDVPILPVLIKDADMPAAERIPVDLHPLELSKILAERVRSNPDFHADAAKLIATIKAFPVAGLKRVDKASSSPKIALAKRLELADNKIDMWLQYRALERKASRIRQSVELAPNFIYTLDSTIVSCAMSPTFKFFSALSETGKVWIWNRDQNDKDAVFSISNRALDFRFLGFRKGSNMFAYVLDADEPYKQAIQIERISGEGSTTEPSQHPGHFHLVNAGDELYFARTIKDQKKYVLETLSEETNQYSLKPLIELPQAIGEYTATPDGTLLAYACPERSSLVILHLSSKSMFVLRRRWGFLTSRPSVTAIGWTRIKPEHPQWGLLAAFDNASLHLYSQSGERLANTKLPNREHVREIIGDANRFRALLIDKSGSISTASLKFNPGENYDWIIDSTEFGPYTSPICLSPQGKLLAVTCANTKKAVSILDCRDNDVVAQLALGPTPVRSIRWLGENALITYCQGQNTIVEWSLLQRLMDRDRVYLFREANVVALSDDGRVAVARSGNTLRIFSTSNECEVGTVEISDQNEQMDVSNHDALTLVWSEPNNRKIFAWSKTQEKRKSINVNNEESLLSLRVDRLGRYVLFLWKHQFPTVHALDFSDMAPVCLSPTCDDEDSIVSASLSEDGSFIVTGSKKGVMNFWVRNEGGDVSRIGSFANHGTQIVDIFAHSRKGRLVIAADQNGVVSVTDSKHNTVKIITEFPSVLQTGRLISVSDDEEVLAIAPVTQGSKVYSVAPIICVWRIPELLASKKIPKPKILKEDFGAVFEFVFMRFVNKTHRLVTACSDGRIVVWDVSRGGCVADYYGRQGPITSMSKPDATGRLHLIRDSSLERVSVFPNAGSVLQWLKR